MSSMAAAVVALENLTLNITQEIHVKASLEVTFEALLEQLGPGNAVMDGTPMPMKLEAWPGGRWFRDLGDGNGHFWATCAGDQAADAAGIYGADVHVVSGGFECAVPVERDGWRDADQVSSHGAGIDCGRA